MSGGTIEFDGSGLPTGAGDSTVLEWRERQLELWRMTLRARYAALIAVAVVALMPLAQPHGRWVAAAVVCILVPYNAIYDVSMRRRGALSPALAFSDQVLAVGLLAFVPDFIAPILLVTLAVNATSAVAFGRRVAGQAAAVGALGFTALVVRWDPTGGWEGLLIYLISSAFLITVVGGISEIEREIRGRYVDLMGGIDAVVWEQLTHSPTTLYVNRRAEELLGYPALAWSRPGFWADHVHPADLDWVTARYQRAVKAGANTELGYRFIAADGRVVHLHDRVRIEVGAGGETRRVRGVMVDVTDRKIVEQQMDQYLNLIERLDLALFVYGATDLDDPATLRLLAVNPAGANLLDRRADDAIGLTFDELIIVDRVPERELILNSLMAVARTGEGFVFDDLRLNPADETIPIFSANVFPLPGGAVGVSLQDVTERVVAAEVLRHQALHDGLTGLPNRTLLNERLRHALQASSRTLDAVALLVMDVDQFKEVNDALGHDHGDRLLIEMSRRLQRELGSVAETVARLGGDEFAVLLTADGTLEGATRVAADIATALEQPFHLGGISLQVNASVGIAVYPEHAVDSETLARRADVAMYTAKRSGGGSAVYSPEHDQSSVRRLSLLGELRRAIADDELVLHFQPSIDLRTGDICGAEALVRWEHPTHGLTPPTEFIELAEVSGLIQPLTRWVLERAVRQICSWRDEGVHLPVAVNLSVRNLYDLELAPWLNSLLLDHGVEASMLTLEITESELMDDPLYAMEVLGKLKALGLSTSIDDFGTGYSSLAYLKNLPIDELKIDRSFVGSMVTDESDLTIVRSTIDLSHNLGLDVVAEGVEDGATLARLAELGCDRAQGYYLSRPVPADQLTAWLDDLAGRQPVLEVLASGIDRRW
jgi:diguanylate cyclase (GGDEF)-like protein/PAS domain S-box-containing protein